MSTAHPLPIESQPETLIPASPTEIQPERLIPLREIPTELARLTAENESLNREIALNRAENARNRRIARDARVMARAVMGNQAADMGEWLKALGQPECPHCTDGVDRWARESYEAGGLHQIENEWRGESPCGSCRGTGRVLPEVPRC